MLHPIAICVVGLLLTSTAVDGNACNTKRTFGQSSFVCVCSAKSCDRLEPVKPTRRGVYLAFTSDKDSQRLAQSTGNVSPNVSTETTSTTVVTINREEQLQEMLGFGGAFTDAAAINVAKLSAKVQEHLLEAYFGREGLEYNLGRVPVGGSDFSTRAYSYDDTSIADASLEHFDLQAEDRNYKLPLLKRAATLNADLWLLASTWTAPKWMKTDGSFTGGAIKPEFYQTWADYHVRFFEEYAKAGVDFWGVTTGNEPSLALVNSTINSVRWLPHEMAAILQSKWVKNNFGPTIRNSKFKHLKILTLDDQRFFLPWYPELVMTNGTEAYIDGIAVHWYWDLVLPAALLTLTHEHFPTKLLLATEACRGDKPWEAAVALGDWSRAEDYAHGILEDVNHSVQAWIDWNLALNTSGGPNYIGNEVDAPIIVAADADEFYKQPMYYALAHFAKFVPRGSRKLGQRLSDKRLQVAAFQRPDGGIVVVLLNRKARTRRVVIDDASSGRIELSITPRSIKTVLFW